MSERLQKVLAQIGLGSRREIERWIEQGRVSVDGKVAQLGVKVDGQQTVRVDGKPVNLQNSKVDCRVILYNKPEGELCASPDSTDKATIFDNLPRLQKGRWIMVGRLDVNTNGALLLTNDGELAHRLMHPSYEIEREYAVRVFGEVTDEALKNLSEGVLLDDGMASFSNMRDLGGEGINHWYSVKLGEGRNREVKRMWESQGLQVSRLVRTRYGCVELPRGLRRGSWISLEQSEINQLRKLVGLKPIAAVWNRKVDERRKLNQKELQRGRIRNQAARVRRAQKKQR
ncbi:MAG: 23S rRNA pseudouridine(2605) synthase RluB [Pseudomonadota bacterium]